VQAAAYRSAPVTKRVARTRAVFSAALLLLAQFVGAAHFHSLPDRTTIGTPSSASEICPICELALHAPFNPAAPNLALAPPMGSVPVIRPETALTPTPRRFSTPARSPPEVF
jgi:hypothetical protein